jgi:hypothetical protein
LNSRGSAMDVDLGSDGETGEEMGLPPSSTVSFLHAVGASTLRQGIAVPVLAQVSWLAGLPKGQSLPVTIEFGDGGTVTAPLRRLNNARGHLQFRYESSSQRPLREYLARVFGGQGECGNGLLRVTEVQPRVFRFEPIAAGRRKSAFLTMCSPQFHNCSQGEAERLEEFRELQECLKAVPYHETHGQADYNKRIAATLRNKAWKEENRILKEIGLRCDFEKNGVWVEVEFGNARVYYQDYVKFELAARHRQSRLGILLCPTNAFAQLLCDLGQRRARARMAPGAKRPPTYSGMMSLEKAIREFFYLQFMLVSRMVVAGIEIQGA